MDPACLGDETIAALLEGRLAGARGEATRAHLAGCDECRRLVSATVAALPEAPTAAPAPHAWGAPGLAPSLAPGAVLDGKYRIERALGQGGMGRVLVARQLGLDRPVAIKLLHPELANDPDALQRFRREAKLVASLHSEHVVRVHDFGEAPGGEPYLVMELLDGEDLSTIVARGPLEPARALAWLRAAAEAVAEAHASGIVHRDLKPGNLLLTRAGRIKVLDFGLAKLAPAVHLGDLGSMTQTGALLGSPHYMAPEQIVSARHADARADVWSLGATLFHLVRGFPPFAQPTLDAVFASILSGWLPPMDSLPPAIAAVIRRAMAPDPAARFADAGELLRALDHAAATLAQPPAPAPRMSGIRTLLLAATGGTLAAAAVAFAMRAPAPPLPPPPSPKTSPTSAPRSASPAEPRSSSNPASEAPPPSPSESRPSSLQNLDETRVIRRLTKLGWTLAQTSHDAFPGCEHTRLVARHADQGSADVFLLDCLSPAHAASELGRLRRGFSHAWFSLDGARLLMVARDDERQSAALGEALARP